MNEDAYLAAPGLFVVADGMGGHAAGDVASELAVDVFAGAVEKVPIDPDELLGLLSEANSTVRNHARQSDRRGMGTTLVGLALIDNAGSDDLVVFHVGDSRCYRLTEAGALEQLTTDHSVVQRMIDRGEITREEARHHAERSVVTRAIGVDDEAIADFAVLAPSAWTRVLLCSDGVSGEMTDEVLTGVLASADSVSDAADAVVAAVDAGPARDNATAVVIDIARTSGFSSPALTDSDTTDPRSPRRTERSPANAASTEVAGFDLIDEVPS